MKKSSLWSRIASSLLRQANRWMQKLSLASLYRIGTFIGHLLWYLLPKRRKATIERIQKHIPHIADSYERAADFAHKSMCENGRAFLEIFAVRRFDKSSINNQVHIADPEAFTQITTSPRPVVVVTGHIGSWELLSPLFGAAFLQEYPRAIVARKQNFDPFYEIVSEQRTVTGVQIIDKHQAAPQVLRILKKNGTVAFLTDHNAKRKEAIFLPFLNQIAAVNKGPALLAIRGKAIIWPTCLVRNYDKPYTHTLHIYPYLDTTKLEGTLDEQITEASIFITKAMEQMVLAYPEQWFWMHNRWKTQAPA